MSPCDKATPRRLARALLCGGCVAIVSASPACHNPAGSGSTSAEPTAAASPNADELLYGDAAFKKRLRDAVAKKGADYVPRTKHVGPDGPKYINRLILESSPYLLQHAHNPVNWFPWGNEAFEVAEKLGRPVFLSIGYSTCHWCHVMEEESFEDEAIARYINDHYVAIKVDREERPDVDAVYMRAVQLLTGRGGWPMSVWLTPKREPFYATTYIPPRDGARGASKGFLTMLGELRRAYDEQPATIASKAEALTEKVHASMAPPEGGPLPTAAVLTASLTTVPKRYDEVHGGPRGRPKFPSSFPVRLLLRHALRAGADDSEKMALYTLRQMQAGGIYDHVGGGFHRYSVDERWLVPHFEKMLYDNALLALAYLEGGQVSGDDDLFRVARETLDYVVREMASPKGGYYSATDADSLTPDGRREEGYFFTWTIDEVKAALPDALAETVIAHYGMTAQGNFEGRSILYIPRTREAVMAELEIDGATLDERLTEAKERLRAVRGKRPPPLLDDKIQASWNGLMVAAMARGARVLDEARYAESAKKAADFLLAELRAKGRLHHSIKDGQLGETAFAEDYAFLGLGLVELFEATQQERYLKAAIELLDALEKHHAHPGGGYYRSAVDAEKLLAREVDDSDGTIPAAASWAALAQLKLAALTTQDRWRQRAEATLEAYGARLRDRPWSLDEMMLAVDWQTDRAKEIAIILPKGGSRSDEAVGRLLSVLRGRFVPNHVLVIAEEGSAPALVPWVKDKPAKKGAPTAYVCERGACELPTTDPRVFDKQVTERTGYDG